MSWNKCGLIAIVALGTVPAWFFGGVQRSFHVWLFVAALIAVICWTASDGRRRERLCLPFALLPLLLGGLWGGFQLVPLPGDIRTTLSPQGERLRFSVIESGEEPTGVPENPEKIEPSWQPLSLYPSATCREVSLLMLATSVFAAAAGLVRKRRDFLILTWAIAINGAVLAFFGLLQKLSWNGQLFWSVPLTQGGAPFASFVSRNSAAGYLNMCLAAAIGLLLVAFFRRDLQASILTGRFDVHRLNRESHAGEWSSDERLPQSSSIAFGLTALIAAGVLASLSKGGVLSMAIALGGLFCLVFTVHRVRALATVTAVLFGMILVGWLGFGQEFRSRVETFMRQGFDNDSRLVHWQDAISAGIDFWPVGAGLGSYRYVYLGYQQLPKASWFHHAENQWIEAFVDAGVVGPLLVLGAVVSVCWAGLTLVREKCETRSVAVGVIVLFSLGTQLIHANFDFSLYLPSNFLLLAIFSGAGCGLALRRFPHRWSLGYRLPSSSPAIPITAALFLGAALLWGGAHAFAAGRVETALRAADWNKSAIDIPTEQLEEALVRLESALKSHPEDLHGQLRLAELHLTLYRQQSVQQLAAEAGLETLNQQQRDRLWALTKPELMYAQSRRVANLPGGVDAVSQWRRSAAADPHLLSALKHLQLARRACPLWPNAELRMAELEGAIFDNSREAVYIARAAMLAPSDVDILFRCGMLDLESGRFESAATHWRRCILLDPSEVDRVLKAAKNRFTYSEIATQVLPPDPLLLLDVAEKHFSNNQKPFGKTQILRRAEQLLDETNLAGDEKAFGRGALAQLKGELEASIAHYKSAVELRPDELAWRMRLATLLMDVGRLDEAREQARRCVLMQPQDRPAMKLLKTIHQLQNQIPETETSGSAYGAPILNAPYLFEQLLEASSACYPPKL